MANKKKREILPMLEEIGVNLDEFTQKIIKILERKKTISENKIANRLKLKINDTRKLLYKLQSKGLVTYTKLRDEKRKWWYVYYWSLDRNRINDIYMEHLKKQLAKKKEELATESKYVFECKLCNEKHTYEEALETEFACPKCGELLTEVTDRKIVRRLKREIAALQKELTEIEAERQRAIEREKIRAEKEAAKAEKAKKAKKKISKKKPKPKKKPTKKKLTKKKIKKPKKKIAKKKIKKKPKSKKKLPKKKSAPRKKTSAKKKSITKKVLRRILLRKKRK